MLQQGVRRTPQAEVQVEPPGGPSADLQIAVALTSAAGAGGNGGAAANITMSTLELLQNASGHMALVADARLIAHELSQEGPMSGVVFVLLVLTVGVVAFLLARHYLTGDDEKPESSRRPRPPRGQDAPVLMAAPGASSTRGRAAATPHFPAGAPHYPTATPPLSQRPLAASPRPTASPAPIHVQQPTERSPRGGPGGSGAGPATLCADLVVPEGDECTLQVPRLPSRGGPLSIYVDSMKGAPVFRAQVTMQGARRRLTLSNPPEEVVFGFCRDVQPNASIPRIAVHDHRMAEFGVLQADPKAAGGFIFRSRKGWAVHFGGSPHIQAQDDQGLLLATTDPMGEPNFVGDGKRPLRIGPEVDAGLIVLCFLGIDLLQTEG